MKILITVYRSLGYGGAEVSTRFLSREFEKLGHKVIVASTQPYKDLDTILFKEIHKFYTIQEEKHFGVLGINIVFAETKVEIVEPTADKPDVFLLKVDDKNEQKINNSIRR